jgi:hypothetical protein
MDLGALFDSSSRSRFPFGASCSEELYNLRVQTLDWRKSDATRILLKTPFELFVISQPFANYPQELCARMTLRYFTEQTVGNVLVSVTLLPDEELCGHYVGGMSISKSPSTDLTQVTR